MIQIYVAFALTASVICAGLLLYSWNLRNQLSGRLFMMIIGTVCLWCLGSALIPLAGSFERATFLFKLVISCSSFGTFVLFYFVIVYTGYEYLLSRRVWWFLFLVPLITLVLIWSNPYHHFFLEELRFYWQGKFINLDAWVPGPWMPVHLTYSYLLAFVMLGVTFMSALKRKGAYRRSGQVIIIAVLPPVIASIVWSLGIIEGLKLPLAPLALVFTLLILGYELVFKGFVKLVPLARSRVFDLMQDAVIIIDPGCLILDINQKGRDLIGLSSRVVAGLPLVEVGEAARELHTYLKRGELTVAPLILQEQGEEQYYQVRVSKMGEHADHDARIVILQNITRQHLSEQEILQYTADLEQKNKDLDAYSHTVAHDLKVPLRSMMNYSEMILNEHSMNKALQEHIPIYEQTAKSMFTIIEALLLFAQVSRIKELKLEQVPMNEVIRTARSRVQNLARERGGTIWISTSLPPIKSYAPWLEEIWVNYLSNALKYGGDDPVVEVSAHVLDNGYIRYQVRDYGPGIAPEKQVSLFKDYSRLNRKADGHGLGLSIVKRIIEKLEGRVGVESEINEGSTFYFELPFATDQPVLSIDTQTDINMA